MTTPRISGAHLAGAGGDPWAGQRVPSRGSWKWPRPRGPLPGEAPGARPVSSPVFPSFSPTARPHPGPVPVGSAHSITAASARLSARPAGLAPRGQHRCWPSLEPLTTHGTQPCPEPSSRHPARQTSSKPRGSELLAGLGPASLREAGVGARALPGAAFCRHPFPSPAGEHGAKHPPPTRGVKSNWVV